MKTIKIKILLTQDQITLFNQYTNELEWLWNTALSNQLHNHCINWYSWAEKLQADLTKATETLTKLKPEQQQLVRNFYNHKHGEKQPKLSEANKKLVAKFEIFTRWLPFDLEGITKVPLRLGNSGYEWLSCQIATGGDYWKRDDSFNIPIKKKGEIIYIKGSKLTKGDKPWQRIATTPHTYKTFLSGKFEGREITDIMKLDNISGLNSLRAFQNLPDLTISSDYIGGTLEFFKQAWLAFLDPKRINSRKPKFKRLDTPLTTLSNNQKPPNKINSDKQTVTVTGLGEIQIIDRSWRKRLALENIITRTYMITKKPSGYYINIVVAHQLQEEKAKLSKQLPKIKKEFGEESQQYLDLLEKFKSVSEQIKLSSITHCKELSVGIDPGVSAIAATDHGALFLPNLSRERISIHIEELQSKLNKAKDINDANWKALGNKGTRPKTANEIKLQAKISRLQERGANSANSFNHKLSTRISRTYKDVCWEDTQLTNLLKQTAPQALPEGVGYAHNGASAKRGLNWILKQRCLGDLKAKTKQKVEASGNNFHDPSANYSSQTCHCCGQKGERLSQHEFICKNLECEILDKVQQADVNAARNHKKNSDFELGIVKYHTIKLQYQKTKRFKRKKLTE
ncbi:zinc ribbon domain-containing protein [Anabaena sp. WFMT]|uniref:zinc ribbon domain-containing protein n=1 Tax=Anabaena sp. WFMT TaxID=3449730 RepID=UPI003F23C9A7